MLARVLMLVVLIVFNIGATCNRQSGTPQDTGTSSPTETASDGASNLELEWVYNLTPTDECPWVTVAKGDGEGATYLAGYGTITIDIETSIGTPNSQSKDEYICCLRKVDESGNLVWIETFGEGEYCKVHGMVIDEAGDVYLWGESLEADMDPGPEILKTTGTMKGYISKYNSDGEYQWTFFRYSTNSTLLLDDDDTIYILDSNADLSEMDGGGFTRYLANLALVDYYGAFSFGPDGNIYITGQIEGTTDFDPGPGVEERTPHPDGGAFLSKYTPDGELLWVKMWTKLPTEPENYNFYENKGENKGIPQIMTGLVPRTTPSGPSGKSITFDDNGNVYVAGSYGGTVDFDPGPETAIHSMSTITPSPYDQDFYLSKFDSNGEFQWVKVWGNEGWENWINIVSDEYGHIYTAGVFFDTLDFDPSPEIIERTTAPGESLSWIEDRQPGDVFLSRFDTDGNFDWVETWGSPDYEDGRVFLDNAGYIYLYGSFMQTVDFDPGPGVENGEAGERNAFYIMKLKALD